jgi:23S rRNA pseudouridine1911/1915/1917 synthase
MMDSIQAIDGEKGLRVDVWLERRLEGLSRSRVQALLKSGRITVNGGAVKAGAAVQPGWTAVVDLPPPEPVALAAENIPLAVLYEDADVVVINKPPGLVVHPAAGHASGTLVNALLYHCDDLAGIGGELRPGIVHRLDRDTSGVMVAAKNQRAMESLTAQFKARTVAKEYLAVVAGVPGPLAGRIETLIGRSAHNRKKMTTRTTTGRPAVSRYEVVEVLCGASLVRVKIETGRTHQIRVHMAHIGHPVVGDPQYGRARVALPAPAARQMLHAQRLAFDHPATGARMTFEAPLPPDMAELIARLKIIHR